MIGWLVIDALLLAGAFAVAYQLRWDFQPPEDYTQQFHRLIPFVVAVELALLWLFGLYRRMIRYAGGAVLFTVAGALTVALLVGLIHWLWRTAVGDAPSADIPPWRWPIPRAVLAINWLTAMAAIGGARMARHLSLGWPAGRPKQARRALVVGTTDVGDFAVRMLRQSPQIGLWPVAFLDESGAFTGRTIRGLPIVGALSDLGEVLKDWQIDEVLIALPSTERSAVNRVVEECRRHRVAVRALPNQNELIAGQRTLGALRPVDVAELLGREHVETGLSDEMNYVRGEVVFITGAGGSIGSELSRQISALGPAKMILIGRGENSLFELGQELGPDCEERRYVVTDVRDEAKMTHLFAKYRPGVVFHAAAHKHVPLMECAPDEAVKNNILATDLLARLATEHGVKRFVLISSDKAVRPTSVMGISKRLAEQVVTAWAMRSDVRFVAVRFGNVLGSRGSVVPIFRSQIERGGPITVTDPGAERYFMTVKEAVSLVLQAGAVGESGQLCVLDMGEPVKIDDLARNLITLSGLEPGTDIAIEYTGLRPGEKLKEEYLSAQEGLEKTAVGKVWVTRLEVSDGAELARDLDSLRSAAERADNSEILRILTSRVKDHKINIASRAD